MAFKNRVRLPIELSKPQFPTERQSFRKADGSKRTLYSTIDKTYEGETDYFPERWHQALVVALNHDEVVIEGDRYIGNVSIEGDYDIQHIDFLNYPTAPARFKISVNPFDATNTNCQTCEEATQIDLVDDTIADPVEEGQTYYVNVIANDSVCCYPVEFSISPGTVNTVYVEEASINSSGVVRIVLKIDIPVANNAKLLSYRATCPNGGYDEAGVFASHVNGTIEQCLSPTGLAVEDITKEFASVHWTAPDPAPALGYKWQLFKTSMPGSPVQENTTTGTIADLYDLEPNTEYTFYVLSDCDGGDYSDDVSIGFKTNIESEHCGEYELLYILDFGDNIPYITASYVDCGGVTRIAYLVPGNSISKRICALQYAAGNPLSIFTDYASKVTQTYIGPC